MRRLPPILALLALLAFAPAALGAARSPQPGIDPGREPLVASFSCYSTAEGDAWQVPAFVLEIRPGRQYHTDLGDGTFAIDATETVQTITWTAGPLATDDLSTVFFDDDGQTISRVSLPGVDRPFRCYQQGAREQVARSYLAANDPQPGTLPCVPEDGSTGVDLVLLPGRRYALGGVEGAYTADILGEQDDDQAYLTFVGGPLDGENAFFTGDPQTGRRSMRIYVRPRLVCEVVVAPTPRARYGPGQAPKAKPLKGGLSGLYAAFQVDVTGVCGGLCWTYRDFRPNGYVYTREPDTGRADAACGRVLPNGLPVCERYRLVNGKVAIGDAAPVAYRRRGGDLLIDGRRYFAVQPLKPGARLRGTYRSLSVFSPIPGQGGVAVERVYVFKADGTFERTGFVSATSTPPPGQPGVSVTVASQNGSSGRYRILAAQNQIELRFANGVVQREFAWISDPGGKLPAPESIRFSGADFLRKSR